MAAMAVCIAERGFRDTTVNDVIDRAGASRRTFYTHFRHVDDCLLATYEAVVKDVCAAAEHAGAGGPLAPALHAALEHLARWPEHIHVLSVNLGALGPRGRERHEATMARLVTAIMRYDGVVARRQGRLTAEEVVDAKLGAVQRVITRRLRAGELQTLPGLSQDLAGILSRPLSD